MAFNIIHHCEKQWERATNAILNLGDNIIIKIPLNSSCSSQLENYLIAHQSNIIWETPKHIDQQEKSKIFWFKHQKTSLDRHHWLGKKGFSSDYIITSNFNKKNIYKKREHKINHWIPGINLLTFKMLDGFWPNKNMIKVCIGQMRGIEHEDLIIWNMIIQGTHIVPIDYSITSKNPFDSDLCISFDLGMIEQDSPTSVMQWFKDNWPHFTANQGHNIPLSFFDCE